MTKKRAVVLLVLLCVGTVAVFADQSSAAVTPTTVTLDFEDLRFGPTSNPSWPRIYGGTLGRDPRSRFQLDNCSPPTPQCFMLVALHFSPDANFPRFSSFTSASPSFAGSTGIYHGISWGEVALQRVDGRPFDLKQIDIAPVPSFDTAGNPIVVPFTVTLRGVKSDGRVVEKPLRFTANTVTFQRFTLSGLDDVTQVIWFQGTDGAVGGTHQVDNIVLSTRSTPSPTTTAQNGALPTCENSHFHPGCMPPSIRCGHLTYVGSTVCPPAKPK